MSNGRFLALTGTSIMLLPYGFAIKRYRDCLEKGGHHCKVGLSSGPSVPKFR